MSDDDLIRRGDAMSLYAPNNIFSAAQRKRIAALPAVTAPQGVDAGDDMLAIMLAMIDSAMGCSDEEPVVFKVTPSELASWADAVQKYEEVRFPLSNGEPK
jgi:hypothetical protein